MRRGLFIGALLLGACDPKPQPAVAAESGVVADAGPEASVASPTRALEAAADAATVAHGKALVSHYQCNRCHDIDGVTPPQLEYDCAGCHQEILAGTFDASAEELTRWQGRLTSFDEVPSLTHTDRFVRTWVASFLPDAHDVRPNLPTSMPRFSMPAEDAEAIAAFLVPSAEPEVPEALFGLDNVVLSPHQGSATWKTRTQMGELVIRNIEAHFSGDPLLTPVA